MKLTLWTTLIMIGSVLLTSNTEPPPLYPFNLTGEQTMQIFKNFMWALESAGKTGSPLRYNFPFGIDQTEAEKLLKLFKWSMVYTSLDKSLNLEKYDFPDVRISNNSNLIIKKIQVIENNNSSGGFPSFSLNAKKKEEVKINEDRECMAMSLEVFSLLNKYRRRIGLSMLTWNPSVYNITLKHCVYMEEQGKISHDLFKERMDGHDFQYTNENVAAYGGYDVDSIEGAKKFMEMWINSEGHNKNMISDKPNQGAVAVYKDADNKYYATMILVKAN